MLWSFPSPEEHRLTVRRGEKVVVCGPSGSGKSTKIRCMNRLEEQNSGRIATLETELNDDVANIDEIRREAGWCSSISTCSRT